MNHHLSKPDYLQEVNDALLAHGPVKHFLAFTDFVLIEEDWCNGFAPEDVARRIYEGTHRLATRSEFFA